MDALTEAKNLIVRRWGEMGGYWGINRTMAEIHALLFVTRKPLCTDEIMDQLKISRGNASMNLRGLVDWGLIERVHQLGDRKEYFVAHTSVWRMFEIIMKERRRREEDEKRAREAAERQAKEEAERKAAAPHALSEREFEVLELLAAGRSNKEIASQLSVSPNTVKSHLAKLYSKLDVTRRTEAILKARELGMLR